MRKKGDMGISLLRNIIFALLVAGLLIGLYLMLSGKIRPYAADLPKQLITLFNG